MHYSICIDVDFDDNDDFDDNGDDYEYGDSDNDAIRNKFKWLPMNEQR